MSWIAAFLIVAAVFIATELAERKTRRAHAKQLFHISGALNVIDAKLTGISDNLLMLERILTTRQDLPSEAHTTYIANKKDNLGENTD